MTILIIITYKVLILFTSNYYYFITDFYYISLSVSMTEFQKLTVLELWVEDHNSKTELETHNFWRYWKLVTL